MGHPMPGWDVKILDEDKRPVAQGGAARSACARARPALSARLLEGRAGRRGERSAADSFHAKDAASEDTDGYIEYEGRANNVIISTSYRSARSGSSRRPSSNRPSPRAAAVALARRAPRDECVKAFIMPATGHEPSDELGKEISALVASICPPTPIRRVVEFVDDLPTLTGKIRRIELQSRARRPMSVDSHEALDQRLEELLEVESLPRTDEFARDAAARSTRLYPDHHVTTAGVVGRAGPRAGVVQRVGTRSSPTPIRRSPVVHRRHDRRLARLPGPPHRGQPSAITSPALARGGGEERDITYADLRRDVQRFANALREPRCRGRRRQSAVPADDPRGRRRDARLRAHRRAAQRRLRRLSPESVRSAWRSPRRRSSSPPTARGTRAGRRRSSSPSTTSDTGRHDDRRAPHRHRLPDGRRRRLLRRDHGRGRRRVRGGRAGREHPLFILYSSGSTAKPKGILHSTGGYLTCAAYTRKVVFDLKPETDVYFCSADVGWITGRLVLGLPGRSWTAPRRSCTRARRITPTRTSGGAVQRLRRDAAPPRRRFGRASRWDEAVPRPPRPLPAAPARLGRRADQPEGLGLVLPRHRRRALPVVDTWWQTETGAIMISPLPGITHCKPGSATQPLPGVVAAVVGEDGEELPRDEQGLLTLQEPWPSMLRTLYGDDDRYVSTYFEKFGPETYFVGDASRQDADDYFWVIGRVDDVLNVSGHRMSTAEIESAVVSHPKVAECATIGAADEDTGPVGRILRDARGRPQGHRRARRRDPRARGEEDRQARPAQADRVGRRPAQDALGQDHAPPVARSPRAASSATSRRCATRTSWPSSKGGSPSSATRPTRKRDRPVDMPAGRAGRGFAPCHDPPGGTMSCVARPTHAAVIAGALVLAVATSLASAVTQPRAALAADASV